METERDEEIAEPWGRDVRPSFFLSFFLTSLINIISKLAA